MPPSPVPLSSVPPSAAPVYVTTLFPMWTSPVQYDTKTML